MSAIKTFQPDNWVNNYTDELYRYTLARIHDTGYAEDIVQETFLSAWRARETYKGEATEKNWLFAICKNKIIDYFRKNLNNIVKPSSREEDIYFDEAEHWKENATPVNWHIDYQQQIETKEFYTVLDSCKKKLKDIQQAVFVLKYLENLEAEKICKVLDISASNYWVLIHRCKLHLRSCLEKNWMKY